MTAENSKKITLFTYVKAGEKYIKKTITLSELVALLSDNSSDVPGAAQGKNHSMSEKIGADDVGKLGKVSLWKSKQIITQ